MYIYLRTFSNTAIPCSAQLTDICTYAYTHIYKICMYITTHIYFHTSLLVALVTSAFPRAWFVLIVPPRLIRVDFAVELDAPHRLAPRVYLACASFLRVSIHASHSGIPRPKHSRPFSPKRWSVITLILARCKTADAGAPPTGLVWKRVCKRCAGCCAGARVPSLGCDCAVASNKGDAMGWRSGTTRNSNRCVVWPWACCAAAACFRHKSTTARPPSTTSRWRDARRPLPARTSNSAEGRRSMEFGGCWISVYNIFIYIYI